MPATYKIFPQRNLVYVRYAGVVTTDESVNTFIAYLVSGQAKPGHVIFVDFEACTELQMDFEDMVRIVPEKLGLIDPYEATMVTAMYAPQPAIFEACMTYRRLVSGSERQMVEVFDTKSAAFKFLGIATDSGAELALDG